MVKTKVWLYLLFCANDLSETRNNDCVGFYCENDIFNFQIRVDMTMHPFSLLTIVCKGFKVLIQDQTLKTVNNWNLNGKQDMNKNIVW